MSDNGSSRPPGGVMAEDIALMMRWVEKKPDRALRVHRHGAWPDFVESEDELRRYVSETAPFGSGEGMEVLAVEGVYYSQVIAELLREGL